MPAEDNDSGESSLRPRRQNHHGDREDALAALVILYRPRLLYISSFLWLTVVGGRFLAPFLEHEGGLTAPQIGVCLAVQQAAITLMTTPGGTVADGLEAKYPGYGRVAVVCLGVLTSTGSFLLHGVAHFVPGMSVFTSVAWHAALQGLHGMAVSLVFPVLDGLTVDFLERVSEEGAAEYGKERLHGPLWWAVGNLLLSALLDRLGFAVCYPLALVTAIAFVVTSYLYTQQQHRILSMRPYVSQEDEGPSENAPPEEETPRRSVLQLLGMLFSTGACFLICLVLISSGQAVVDNLVFLFFEALGSSWALMGLTVVIKIAFEVPVFFYGKQLLQRLGGPAGVLLVGCACYFGRVVAYTYIPPGKLFFCLLLEPLHGITYGAVQLALVEFAAITLPAGYEASGQGLVYLFREGGSVAGVYLGGWVDGHLGAKNMFQLSALLVAIGGGLLAISEACRSRREKPQMSHLVPTEDPESPSAVAMIVQTGDGTPAGS